MHNFEIIILGTLVSSEAIEPKVIDGRVVEGYVNLNYLRVDSKTGKMEVLKVKSYIGIPKAGQLVSVIVSSFNGAIYYKAKEFLNAGEALDLYID
jgi:hypothetical protein